MEAGHEALETAQRELHEELGLDVPLEVPGLRPPSSNTIQIMPDFSSVHCPCYQCHHSMTCHHYQIEDFHSILMGESLQTFEHMFSTTHCSVLNGGAFVNNEHIDVYIVSLPEIIPLQDFVLQESEVSHLSRARLLVVF